MGLNWVKKSHGEEGTSHVLGLGHPMPWRLKLLLDLPPAPVSVQARNGWSDWDHSPNVRCSGVLPPPCLELTARRLRVPDSTDGVRVNVGSRQGLHVWRVSWPAAQRGSHAAVGVGTASAGLHAAGYRVLVGGEDGESWGWGLVDGRLYHAGRAGRLYPDSPSGPLLPVPDTFLVVLDSDEGTLSFVVDGQYLGVGFGGLENKTLYPMISCVWGNACITLTYINQLQGQPVPLTDLCRHQIRTILGKQRMQEVDALLLPRTLKNYLHQSSEKAEPFSASPSSYGAR